MAVSLQCHVEEDMSYITVALERLSRALMQRGETDCKLTFYTPQTRFTHMLVGYLHLPFNGQTD